MLYDLMLHGYWFNVVCIIHRYKVIFKITLGHANRNGGPPIRVRRIVITPDRHSKSNRSATPVIL